MAYTFDTIKTFTHRMRMDSILWTKPRKEIPKYLIYYNEKLSNYTLFSGKTGEVLGKMHARPMFVEDRRSFYPNMIGYTSFYISSLKAKIKRQGIGSALMNLAKHESIRRGCEGRIHLIAKNITREADNRPLVAYRKMGFESQYKWAIECADRFIKTGEELHPMTKKDIPMYLPVKNYCAKFNKFCKLSNNTESK